MSRIAVVGLGLIGGSIAAGLRRAGHGVRGFDNAPGRPSVACERALVDDAAETLGDCVRDAEVVILATPVSAILALLPVVDALAPSEAVIIDAGSVKSDVVGVMAQLAHPGRAIGGHPIAGTEMSGPEVADADLLAGRTFALCPSHHTGSQTRERAAALVRDMRAVPLFVEAARHDEVVARTSHLPQMVSTALALYLESADLSLAGPGIRGMTRLARSDARMWSDIIRLNRRNIAEAMHLFARQFDELGRLVEEDDTVALADAFARGSRAVAPLAAEVTASELSV
jgi:prephenate dehydrogenase